METLMKIAKVFDDNRRISLKELCSRLACSERKVRQLIRDLRDIESRNGFEIMTLRNYGYEMRINDLSKYEDFIQNFDDFPHWDYEDQEQRVNVMTSVLLLSDSFVTIDEIAKVIDVSRSTIQRDLPILSDKLGNFELTLETRKYHGIRIQGSEQNKRRMFNGVSFEISDYRDVSEDYWVFLKSLDIKRIKAIIVEISNIYHIQISNEGIDSIVEHITIMLYRLKHHNTITEFVMNVALVQDEYRKAAEKIIVSINEFEDFEYSILEVDLLATQILGKANIDTIPHHAKTQITGRITNVLIQLDGEFETRFSFDATLVDSLLHHVYPLMLRLSFKLELTNPIKNIIPVRYMNSVLIALRFIEKYNEDYTENLSEDEIGYLALHFATHFERESQKAMLNVANILYISSSYRSHVTLNKERLSQAFPNASIVVRSSHTLENIKLEDIDLILYDKNSDQNFEFNQKGYQINNLITDDTIEIIRNGLIQKFHVSKRLTVDQLFYEDLIFVDSSKDDYLTILNKYTKKMMEQKYAGNGFAESVIGRELKYTTVYEKGIAAPHSMEQCAVIDSVAVVALTDDISYQKKTVNLIFIINIQKGHLFLYQEISDCIIWVIAHAEEVRHVLINNGYNDFIQLVKERV